MSANPHLNEEANKLFVEAALLKEESDALAETDFEASYAKASAADERVQKLLADYGGSNVVVEMLLGRAIFDLKTIKALRERVAAFKPIVEALTSPLRFVLFLLKEGFSDPRVSGFESVIAALARSGSDDAALSYVNQLSEELRVSYTLTIAEVLLNEGDALKARALILSVYNGSGFESDSGILDLETLSANVTHRLARLLVRIDQVEEALEVVSRSPCDLAERDAMLASIAEVLGSKGDVDYGLTVSEQIHKTAWKAYALSDLANALKDNPVRRGAVYQDALKLAATISYEYDRACVRGYIASSLAFTGDIEQAFGVTETIENSFSAKARALFAIVEHAKELYSVADVIEVCRRAWSLARGLDDDFVALGALCRLGVVMARIGDFDAGYDILMDALGRASGGKWPYDVDIERYTDVAKALANIGEVDMAMVMVEEVSYKDDTDKAIALSKLAVTIFDVATETSAHNLLQQATELTWDISDKRRRALALVYIGTVHANIGNSASALHCFKTAWHVASETSDTNAGNEEEQDDEDDETGSKQTEKLWEDMQQVFMSSEDNESEGEIVDDMDAFLEAVRTRLVRTLTKEGDLEQALKVAMDIKEGCRDALRVIGCALGIRDGLIAASFSNEERQIADSVLKAFHYAPPLRGMTTSQ